MVTYIAIAVIVVIAAIVFYKRKRGSTDMSQGLQVFDNSEKLILDLANCTTYVYGTANTNGVAGSVSDSRIDGRTWVAVIGVADAETLIPVFTVGKGVISWTKPSAMYGHAGNVTIMYGAY